ncbi:MAG: Athe_2463 domain-containing protein [Ruminiclostridium sp.]
MKLFRSLTSSLIVSILMFSIDIINVAAATNPSYVLLKQIHNKPNYSTKSIDAKIEEIAKTTNNKQQNIYDEWLNPFVYTDYTLVVYGVPSEDFVGDFYERADGRMRYNGKAGEYKYLGENAAGELVTNDRYYPSGTEVGSIFPDVQSYKNINWNNVTGAEASWKTLSQAQIDKLSNKYFSDDDYYGECINGDEVELTLTQLLGSSLKQKAKVQVAPSLWSVNGSVRLEYGLDHWNTVIFKSLAPNTGIEASIASQDTYTITANMDSITVPYTVTGTVNGDIVNNNLIYKLKEMTFTSYGANTPTGKLADFSNNNPKQQADFKITYYRSNQKEGINKKTLSGVTTVKTDDARDKPITANTTKPLELIVEPKPPVKDTGKITVRCFEKGTTEDIPNTGVTYSNLPYNISKTIAIPPVAGYKAIGGYRSAIGLPIEGYMDKPAKEQVVKVTANEPTWFVYFWYEKDPNSTDPTEPDNPPVPINYNPIAIINNPAIAYAGDDVKLDGSKSYDEDGFIEHYEWELPGTHEDTEGENTIGDTATGLAWYPNVGEYEIWLTVTDDDNDIGEALSNITIIPPNPNVIFDISADKMKENRKITLDVSESTSAKKFPIDWNLNTWTISPVSGTGATGDYGVRLENGKVYKNVNGIAQLYNSGTWTSTGLAFNTILKGQKTLQFQARDSGKYTVNVTLTNTATFDSTKHYSSSSTREINVVEDLAPIADFTGAVSNIRDIESPNGSTTPKYGIIPVICTTISPDGDPIGIRKWAMRYDSDNDGILSDETTIYSYTGNESFMNGIRFIVNGDRDTVAEIWSYEVGHYTESLEAIEDIPDIETVKELLLASDYRSNYVQGW